MGPIAFLKTRTARRWVPVPLSILIHACLIGALVWGYRSYREGNDQRDLPRATVADALLVENAPVGGLTKSTAQLPSPVPVQSLIAAVPNNNPKPTHAAPLSLSQSLISGNASTGRPLVGLPAPSAAASSVGISATSVGPTAQFMGISGDAIRVIFVCDASGSMMDRLPILENQLRNSINQLEPIQWFNVIFFQDSKALTTSAKGLIQALPEKRRDVVRLMQSVQAMGNSNPMAAINLAFSQHPQVIYLLTDGDFDPGDPGADQRIVQQFHELNSAQKVRVNTILFISSAADLQNDDPKAGQKVLRQIASENGGTFKVVLAE